MSQHVPPTWASKFSKKNTNDDLRNIVLAEIDVLKNVMGFNGDFPSDQIVRDALEELVRKAGGRHY